MDVPQHYRLMVLGTGPAGCTAAIYAARANLTTAIITGIEQGGQLTKSAKIENWPGESTGITGMALMEKMLNQAQRFNAKVITDSISQVKLKSKPFHLQGDNTTYTCDSLIIATGASAKYLGLPSEQKFMGRGVSACAVCDGFFYKNQKVAVVGGGNTAAENALHLAQLASEVTIIHRRDQFRAEPILVNQLKKLPNINFEFNSIVKEILGNELGVTSIKIKNVGTNVTKELEVAGVFIAIGYQPNTDIFMDQLAMHQGYLKIGYDYPTATSIPGVFAAGDVTDQNYHQAVIAAGSGCMAALDAKKFFDSL